MDLHSVGRDVPLRLLSVLAVLAVLGRRGYSDPLPSMVGVEFLPRPASLVGGNGSA